MIEPTTELFLKDVAAHAMTVLLDNGTYRHLRFRQPNTGNLWFDLVTWPGVLTIHGDMGTWTFSRVDDMFTFFRDSKLRINPDYWGEKLQHGQFPGRDGGKVWDQDTFQAHLLAQLEEHDLTPEKLAELKTAIQEEIFRLHDGDGPHMIRHAAYEFAYKFEEDQNKRDYLERLRNPHKAEKFQFDGMDLPSGMVYSYHFIWCLYAIVWGIQQWDARNAGVPE